MAKRKRGESRPGRLRLRAESKREGEKVKENLIFFCFDKLVSNSNQV
jgi:hypothetical protein